MVIHTTRAQSVLRAGVNVRKLDLCTLPRKAAPVMGSLNMARKLRRKATTALSVPTRTEHLHPDEIASPGDSQVTLASRSDTMRIS